MFGFQIVTVQDHAYFTWEGLNAIWRSDGTTAGTYALPDSGFWQARLANVKGHLLMTGIRQQPDQGGWTGGFWRSNAAGDGLELVRDLADTYVGGTYDLYGTPPSIGNLAWFSFNVDPVVTGRTETWRSDGTPEGTVSLGEMPLSIGLFSPGRGIAYAQLHSDDGDRVQLWRSDGTPGGTVPLHEFADDDWRNERGPLAPFVVVGSRYYAVARQIGQPQVLWVSDGTPDGTRPVRPLATMTPEGARLNVALAADGEMLYALEQDGGQLRLWRSDGTLEGTDQIAVYRMPERPFELSLRAVNGTAVFLAPLAGGGSELFRSSSEPGVIFSLGDIRPGPESSNPTGFVRVGNLLYFIAADGRHGEELWATDLTGPFVIHHAYLPALRR